MKKYAVIVAGGKGVRLGTEIPKQFLTLSGKPVVFHAIEKFTSIVDEVVLVLPKSHMTYFAHLADEYQPDFNITVVAGGESRPESVVAGLNMLKSNGLVAIHDAVRPLMSADLIRRVFSQAAIHGNAVPVVPMRDSIRLVRGDKSQRARRDSIVIVQTPQCFDLELIKSAYKLSGSFEHTDDSAIFEQAGGIVHQTEGETFNIKITFKEDLAFAEAWLNATKL